MKKSIRIISVILAASLTTGLLTGCGPAKKVSKMNADPAAAERIKKLNTTGDFPIVKEPINLKFMVATSATQDNYAGTLVWTEYEKMTNVHIDWETVPSNSIAERRNLVLSSGQNLPDAFYRCNFGSKDVTKYAGEGLFLGLNDLIDNYMPNFKKLMSSMDSLKRSMPDSNGEIYSLPSLTDCPETELSPKLFLNKPFMDRVGITKLPTTLDELYATCKAMRDKDANGNGKSDEVPLVSSSWTGMLRAFCGAYGLMNKGTRHPYVDLDPKTKKLRFVPTAPEFRQQLEFIHKMYSEKLIDNDIFQSSSTITSSTLAKSSMNLVGGVIFTNLTPVTGDRQKDFVGIEEALKGPNGDKIWSCIRSHIVTKGAFTISKTNPYPEATARWMDYWYSEAGSRMFYLGVEGKSYFKDTDGKYKFKPELVKVPEGQNFDAVVSKITPYVGGNSPVLLLSNYFSGNEMEPVPSKAAKDLLKYAPEPWEYFINTNEEMERMSSLEADIISGYYNSVIPQFITGQKPLDDQNWNEYVAKYDKMGLSEYMDLYNKGYERYMKAK